jgi:hypothetical protein
VRLCTFRRFSIFSTKFKGISMKRRLLGAALLGLSAAVLVACGGGGGSPAATNLTVVPAKGAIYAASATAYQVDGKTTAAAGTTTAKGLTDAGKTTLNVGSYSGIVLLNVAGSSSAQYYDEKLNADANFPATANLVSAIPSVTAGASTSVGVTPLTTMAAKLAGIDPANLGKSTFVAPGKISADTLLEGAVRTLLLLGLPADFNIFAAPTPATNSTAPTDIYGQLLFNLGKNASVSALDLFFNATTGMLSDAVLPVAKVSADGVITVTFTQAQKDAFKAFNTAIKAAAPTGITISDSIPEPTADQISKAKATLKAAVDAGTAPKASGSGSGSGSGTGTATGG